MSSARTLIAALANIADPAETENVRRFYKGGDTTTEVMGVSIGNVFPVAKDFVDMPIASSCQHSDVIACAVNTSTTSLFPVADLFGPYGNVGSSFPISAPYRHAGFVPETGLAGMNSARDGSSSTLNAGPW